MNILLSIILAFYPATLVWLSMPKSFLAKTEALSPTSAGHFFSLLILYAIIFGLCYFVVKKFTSAFLGSRPTWTKVLMIVSVVIVVLFVFYTILPGGSIYPSPKWLSHYLLQDPYNFIAILIPLAVLFLY